MSMFTSSRRHVQSVTPFSLPSRIDKFASPLSISISQGALCIPLVVNRLSYITTQLSATTSRIPPSSSLYISLQREQLYSSNASTQSPSSAHTHPHRTEAAVQVSVFDTSYLDSTYPYEHTLSKAAKTIKLSKLTAKISNLAEKWQGWDRCTRDTVRRLRIGGRKEGCL